MQIFKDNQTGTLYHIDRSPRVVVPVKVTLINAPAGLQDAQYAHAAMEYAGETPESLFGYSVKHYAESIVVFLNRD